MLVTIQFERRSLFSTLMAKYAIPLGKNNGFFDLFFAHFEMEYYRKYFNASQLQQRAEASPGWGVDILTVGHTFTSPKNAIRIPTIRISYRIGPGGFDGL